MNVSEVPFIDSNSTPTFVHVWCAGRAGDTMGPRQYEKETSYLSVSFQVTLTLMGRE